MPYDLLTKSAVIIDAVLSKYNTFSGMTCMHYQRGEVVIHFGKNGQTICHKNTVCVVIFLARVMDLNVFLDRGRGIYPICLCG